VREEEEGADRLFAEAADVLIPACAIVAAASGTHRKASSSWQRIDLGTTAPLLQLRWAASSGDVCERWRRWAPTSAAAQLADRRLPRAPALRCGALLRPCYGRASSLQPVRSSTVGDGGPVADAPKEHNHQSPPLRREDKRPSCLPERARRRIRLACLALSETVLEYIRCTAHWRLTADPASIEGRPYSSVCNASVPIDPFTE
jgi:hypothetical protein